MKYRVGPRTWIQVCCQVCGNLKPCDWLTWFMKVILLVLSLVRTSLLSRPGWCSIVQCTVQYVKLHKCLKERACATILDKTMQLAQFCQDPKMSEKNYYFFNSKSTSFSDIFFIRARMSNLGHFHCFPTAKEDLGKMLQLLSIRGRSLNLCTVVQVLWYKQAKPNTANPK